MFYSSEKITVPNDALSYHFTTSGGPGGQNVNRVATAVQLRIDINQCTMDIQTKNRLKKIAGNRFTAAQVLIIRAQHCRTQILNRKEAINRAQALFTEAEVSPKKRRPTKPSRARIQKRLDEKRKLSEKKSLRRSSVE